MVAIKEASGNIVQIKEIIANAPEGFLTISGDDSLALPIMQAGGVGVISVAANAFPHYFADLIGEQARGGSRANDEKFEKIRPTVKMLFAEGNPSGVKAALTIRCVVKNNLRLPLVPVSEELYGALAQSIEEGNFR